MTSRKRQHTLYNSENTYGFFLGGDGSSWESSRAASEAIGLSPRTLASNSSSTLILLFLLSLSEEEDAAAGISSATITSQFSSVDLDVGRGGGTSCGDDSAEDGDGSAPVFFHKCY